MDCYPRNPHDIAHRTAHLSVSMRGIYEYLLEWQYINERPLPADESKLFKIGRIRGPAQAKKLRRVVDEFFPQIDGGRWDPRAFHDVRKHSQRGMEVA